MQLSDTYKIEQEGRYLKLNVGGIKANAKRACLETMQGDL